MTRMLVFGPPYHASRIARTLSLGAADVDATLVRSVNYPRVLATAPRSEPIVIMRAGYRVGSSTARGRLFEAYWSLLRRSLPNAVPCHYWLGTDVLDTVNAVRAGTVRLAALSAARDDLHLTAAPWLTSELEGVGLHAVTALLPPPHQAPKAVPPLAYDFGVLTYLPAARFDFYGGQAILEAARRMPDVRFDVVGSQGEGPRPVTANVHWNGWVDDIEHRYAMSTVVVRIPQHDGFGNTVIEGLFNGRHVIYTQEVPFVRTVWPVTAEALIGALQEFRDAHVLGRLGLNLAGRAYALEQFDDKKLADHLMTLVRARIVRNTG